MRPVKATVPHEQRSAATMAARMPRRKVEGMVGCVLGCMLRCVPVLIFSLFIVDEFLLQNYPTWVA